MDKAIRFLKTAGIYFVGNVLAKIVSFFLLPIYTRVISPERFGLYDLSISLINLIVPLIFLQIWDGVFRFLFDYEENSDKFKVITNGFVVMIAGMIVYTSAFLAVSSIITIENRILLLLYSLIFAFQYFYAVIARGFLNNLLFVSSGFVNSIASVILNVVLIYFYGMGIEALYISVIIGNILQIIIIEVYFKVIQNTKARYINKKMLKSIMAFAMPLCISTIAFWLLSGLTRLVISHQLSVYDNGLYAVCNKFASTIVLLVGIFQFAWNETAYLISKDGNKKKYYQMGAELIIKVILLGVTFLTLVAKPIFPYLIDESYSESLKLLPIIFVGVGANSCASFLGTLFLAEKSSREMFTTTLASAIINILGLWFFIPRYKLMGATLSLSLSFVVSAALRIYLLKKQGILQLNLFGYVKFIILLAASVALFYTTQNMIILLVCSIFVASVALKTFKTILGTVSSRLLKAITNR